LRHLFKRLLRKGAKLVQWEKRDCTRFLLLVARTNSGFPMWYMEQTTAMNRRLLLIDDDEDLREIFHATLSAISGLEVLLADSGQTGLAIAQQEPLDAILLDVMLPGMNGEVILSQLQANPITQAIPVIFMTSRTHGEDRQHLLDIGGKAVISKACKPPQLAAQVLSILNRL
jgi:DNA-binding response OmpR family regulator